MTAAQVKAAEEATKAIIARNVPVFAKTAPLSQAKAVPGVRAMFDEHYPDPVRMVSVGLPIDQLLGDHNGKLGFTVPVEFCGGT